MQRHGQQPLCLPPPCGPIAVPEVSVCCIEATGSNVGKLQDLWRAMGMASGESDGARVWRAAQRSMGRIYSLPAHTTVGELRARIASNGSAGEGSGAGRGLAVCALPRPLADRVAGVRGSVTDAPRDGCGSAAAYEGCTAADLVTLPPGLPLGEILSSGALMLAAPAPPAPPTAPDVITLFYREEESVFGASFDCWGRRVHVAPRCCCCCFTVSYSPSPRRRKPPVARGHVLAQHGEGGEEGVDAYHATRQQPNPLDERDRNCDEGVVEDNTDSRGQSSGKWSSYVYEHNSNSNKYPTGGTHRGRASSGDDEAGMM